MCLFDKTMKSHSRCASFIKKNIYIFYTSRSTKMPNQNWPHIQSHKTPCDGSVSPPRKTIVQFQEELDCNFTK